jgi:WhiB family redox-sensing transcriptional regulator
VLTATASPHSGASTDTASPHSGASTDTDGCADLAGLLDAGTGIGTVLPCRSHDPDLWFAEAPADLERAKTLCADCPVRQACLASALHRGEPWGVWGGEIFERGAVVARKRPRGRPSKADLERDRAAKETAA